MSQTTTTTTTLNDVLRSPYIRSLIFNHVGQIAKVEYRTTSTKGRDIIQLPHLEMITKYAMPWNFLCHYLPSVDKVLPLRRADVISRYCCHPNATLDTLKHLLEWSVDYEPNKQPDINTMVENGNIEVLEYIINRYPNITKNQPHISLGSLLYPLEIPRPTTLMSIASRQGFIDIVKYLHERNESSLGAMDCNNFEIIKYLHDNVGAESSHKSINLTSTTKDSLDIVKFFHGQEKHQGVFHSGVMDNAASAGLLDVVEFLHFNRSEGATTEAIDQAAWFGHLEIVKFLHFNRTEGATTEAMDNASRNGHLEIVRFLHEHRSEGATEDAMDYAALKGHIEVVKFLHFNRTEGCTTQAFDYCMDFEIIKFLHQNRTDGATTIAMDMAAYNDDFETIKFLHENRSEGCTTESLEKAVVSGNTEMIHYLVQVVKCECTSVAIQTAIKIGRLDILSFLHDNYPSNQYQIWSANDMDLAVRYGNLEIVQFLHNHRQEGCTTEALDNACKYGFMDIVLFLYENRTEGATRKAISGAALNNHFEIVKFLYNNHQNEVDIARVIKSSSLTITIEMMTFFVDILVKEKEEQGKLTDGQEENIEKAILRLAVFGRLELVKYLVSSFNVTTLQEKTIVEIKCFCAGYYENTNLCTHHYEIVHYFETQFTQQFKSTILNYSLPVPRKYYKHKNIGYDDF
ncbi:hypothetical protein DFA_04355 [Cavenderia fasciculata]|uniref:SWIM-type domain-containing protein n=1 Tax=Cavenderia fasciculata TaxID=261658 RepID=F4PPC4_CACFS|nr:uncharacterized protein DFA_04355 [Cavenderia fasciculata]EGG22237.1 hypothetical protein DFA_04355 [Cavenderia fasciculata]|eukprot:XP_004360088.1 hypothetical protein DFA_04355 [Cavenderia fasciculata]